MSPEAGDSVLTAIALLVSLGAANDEGGPSRHELGVAMAMVLHLDVQGTDERMQDTSQVCRPIGSGVYECAITEGGPGTAYAGRALHCRLRKRDGQWRVVGHLTNQGWATDEVD